MPFAKVNGIDLYYESTGTGPPVVLAHGVGGNHAIWWKQVKYFSQWYQVINFDHRGFGLTSDVEGGPGRAAFVDDLEALLDHLEIEKATLVAQSMGGRTCLGFSVKRPERVQALVMAATTGFFEATGALAARQEVVRKATEALVQAERVLSPSFRAARRRRHRALPQDQRLQSLDPGAAGRRHHGPGLRPQRRRHHRGGPGPRDHARSLHRRRGRRAAAARRAGDDLRAVPQRLDHQGPPVRALHVLRECRTCSTSWCTAS